MSATNYFIGRCGGCKGVVRVEAELVRTKRVFDAWGQTADVHTWRVPTGESRGGYAEFNAMCLCGRVVRFRRIFANESTKACNAACTGAKGPSCDCQCKGENHGRIFGGVTMVVAHNHA